MQKQITLREDERIVDIARLRADSENTSLEAELSQWLKNYANDYEGDIPTEEDYARIRKERAARAMRTVHKLRKSLSTNGRKFTRDEMNERR